MYRSNEFRADTDAVEQLLAKEHPVDDLPPEDYPQKYRLDGQVEINGDTVVFYSTGTTFDVWDGDYSENVTEGFLTELSEHLEEDLVIRSVGFTGARHIPDAYQWRVTPDGEVSIERLPDV